MKYEATIKAMLPGNTRATDHVIMTDAENAVEAMKNAIDVWKKGTEPKDIRIKELSPVIVA